MTATAVDPLGKLALIDDAKRAAALALVVHGRIYDLGHVLDESVPVFPGRYFRQTLVTTAHHANPAGGIGANDVNWITELVSATMQLGTHLDALSHLQMGDRGYGGLTVTDLAGTNGVRHLGIETVPQIVRGRHRAGPLQRLSHWGYGIGWGVVRGLFDASGLSPTRATAAHGAAVWSSAQVMLPAMDLAPPSIFWGGKEIAIEGLHHAVYALATGFAYRLLSSRNEGPAVEP
jgi:hypothetical protein